jgi:hypothetical protein
MRSRGVYRSMKTTLIAAITSVCTAGLTTTLLQRHKAPPTALMPSVITLRELRIADSAGVVRAVLGTGALGDRPELKLLGVKPQRGGVDLTLDNNGFGTLYFNSDTTDAKVSVGHRFNCDSLPDSERNCGAWGLQILNLNPLGDAPHQMTFAVGSNGSAFATSTKQPPRE